MTRAQRPLTIAVLAPLRYPIREPHAGGLEAAIWDRVRLLRSRGHRTLLCAVDGSDFLDDGPDEFVLPALVWDDPDEATDTTYPPGYLGRALSALDGALDFIGSGPIPFDVVDNHCLTGLPLARSGTLGVPMVTTLHTPPLPEMLAARAVGGGRDTFVAVSGHTAREWRATGIEATVLPNAVDARRWRPGAGGRDLAWFGRIVPEKGPHLAIEAARLAGMRLRIAGRIGDAPYFESAIAPHLGPDVEYLGPLRQPALADFIGGSACVLVTPMWEEPFGLVVAEALATGTPVAAFDTGGVPEVAGRSRACRLVPMGDVEALAAAIRRLVPRGRSIAHRARTRADAVERFSLEHRASGLEEIFARAIDGSSEPTSLAAV